MTLLEAELAVLVALLALALLLGWRAARAAGERFEARERALDRHAKAIAREPQAVLREAQAALDKTEAVREDARLLHERVDRHMADLKRG